MLFEFLILKLSVLVSLWEAISSQTNPAMERRNVLNFRFSIWLFWWYFSFCCLLSHLLLLGLQNISRKRCSEQDGTIHSHLPKILYKPTSTAVALKTKISPLEVLDIHLVQRFVLWWKSLKQGLKCRVIKMWGKFRKSCAGITSWHHVQVARETPFMRKSAESPFIRCNLVEWIGALLMASVSLLLECVVVITRPACNYVGDSCFPRKKGGRSSI